MNIRLLAKILSLRVRWKWRNRWNAERFQAHQAKPLQDLRRTEYAGSEFYRQHDAGLFNAPLSQLPPLTKPELMEHFDQAVTDRRLRLPDIEDQLRSLLTPRTVLRVREVMEPEGMTQFFGRALNKALSAIQEQDAQVAGAPVAVYRGGPEHGFDMTAGFPVTGNVVDSPGVEVTQLPAGQEIATTTKTTPLVTTALRMGLWRRDRAGHPTGAGLVHHSDAGSQYTSIHFAETLLLEGIAASIGSIGDAYDNALAESTIGLFKTEAIREDSPFRTGPLRTVDDVEWVAMAWVDWYNRARLHSALGNVPPDEHEAAYYADLNMPSHPVMEPA